MRVTELTVFATEGTQRVYGNEVTLIDKGILLMKNHHILMYEMYV